LPQGESSRAARRKRLGQHFLRDEAVARAIVEAAGLGPRDLAVEIGPGHGVLTFRLAAVAGRVLALEVDPVLVRSLASRAAVTPNLDLRQTDALAFEFQTLRSPDPEGHVVVVANLPYAISKPLLLRLFEARGAIHRMVLMLQREVAERLSAAPGGKAYGLLSVVAQLWADLTLCSTVPPSAFSPPPKVESAVIRIVFRTAPKVPLPDEQAFLRIVKAAFGQRRKRDRELERPTGGERAAHVLDDDLGAADVRRRRRAADQRANADGYQRQVFSPRSVEHDRLPVSGCGEPERAARGPVSRGAA